jgi:hypothetical protein
MNHSRLVELANEIEKAEKEEEISIESRLKDLSQLSSEILQSFGLKNFKPSSLSSQLCGAIVTPTVLDPEGKALGCVVIVPVQSFNHLIAGIFAYYNHKNNSYNHFVKVLPEATVIVVEISVIVLISLNRNFPVSQSLTRR